MSEKRVAGQECAFRVNLFQKLVTTDKRLRFDNEDRLRSFIADHPEVEVFAAHDPGAVPSTARSDSTTAQAASR